MYPQLPDPIRNYIEAYNAKNVERMLSCLSHDIRFTNVVAGDVTAEVIGLEEFRELAIASLEMFQARHQDISGALSVANTTIVEISYAATVAKDLPNGWHKGQQVSLKGLSLFEIGNGRIFKLIDQI